jgi:putative transposase
MMRDHVHTLLSVPPKYSVAQVVDFIKGKSAIGIAQNCDKKVRNFTGSSFWARGYFVLTVGPDEELIRNYIRHQEEVDKQYEI